MCTASLVSFGRRRAKGTAVLTLEAAADGRPIAVRANVVEGHMADHQSPGAGQVLGAPDAVDVWSSTAACEEDRAVFVQPRRRIVAVAQWLMRNLAVHGLRYLGPRAVGRQRGVHAVVEDAEEGEAAVLQMLKGPEVPAFYLLSYDLKKLQVSQMEAIGREIYEYTSDGVSQRAFMPIV